MRCPKRKRPRRRELVKPSDKAALHALARRVTYIGSPEHKDTLSFAGHPRLRADASVCDRTLARDQIKVQGWLQDAVRRGYIGEPWEGDFRRYVWYLVEGTLYEGRLINRAQGQYKGYPLTEDEWPAGWRTE